MEISHEEIDNITIMKLDGELDSAAVPTIVKNCEACYESGSRNLLLDMSDVSFMGSAGLVMLHNMSRIMRGESALGNHSVQSLHDVQYELMNAEGKETHFKILSPQPRIAKTLKMTGFDKLLDVFENRTEAIASFAS